MSGHKLLQYRTHLYVDAREHAKLFRAGIPLKMKWLAKTGVYKRKLRQVMDQVERELYGYTRAQIKLDRMLKDSV